MKTIFKSVRAAAAVLQATGEDKINETLRALARNIEAGTERLLDANEADMKRMDPANPKCDRLRLTPERIADIARGVLDVAGLPSPVGRVLDERVRPNGLRIEIGRAHV